MIEREVPTITKVNPIQALTEGEVCKNKFCGKIHRYVCDCGHKHSKHNFSGGCMEKIGDHFCLCDRYSQETQRDPSKKQCEVEEELVEECQTQKLNVT